MDTSIRNDWTKEEIKELYNTPLFDLLFQAQTVHRQYHDPKKIQLCTLLSIKTGGCEEDCKYCPQSSHYHTGVDPEGFMSIEEVLEKAKKAKEAKSTRFCMGAAWKKIRNGRNFDRILEMIKAIKDMGLEPCVTLGMLTKEQAEKLKAAGLYAYNHNLDTSEEYYKEVTTTRTYQDRLDTLENIRNADITVCCGGILGMGETHEDRISLLHTLATLEKHPDSVPINALIPVQGTPFAQQPKVPVWEMARMVATARILIPKSMVRLSAGREPMSIAEQAILFFAGANSIHTGEKLLTTGLKGVKKDLEMFEVLNLEPMEAKEQSCSSKESCCKEETPSSSQQSTCCGSC